VRRYRIACHPNFDQYTIQTHQRRQCHQKLFPSSATDGPSVICHVDCVEENKTVLQFQLMVLYLATLQMNDNFSQQSTTEFGGRHSMILRS
jgi:hypothetical protein